MSKSNKTKPLFSEPEEKPMLPKTGYIAEGTQRAFVNVDFKSTLDNIQKTVEDEMEKQFLNELIGRPKTEKEARRNDGPPDRPDVYVTGTDGDPISFPKASTNVKLDENQDPTSYTTKGYQGSARYKGKNPPRGLGYIDTFFTYTNVGTPASSTAKKSTEDYLKKLKVGDVLQRIGTATATADHYYDFMHRFHVPSESVPPYDMVESLTLDENNNIVVNYKPEEIPEDDNKPAAE